MDLHRKKNVFSDVNILERMHEMKKLIFILLLVFAVFAVFSIPMISKYELVEISSSTTEEPSKPLFLRNVLGMELNPIEGDFTKTHTLTFKNKKGEAQEVFIGIAQKTKNFALLRQNQLYDFSQYAPALLAYPDFKRAYYDARKVNLTFFSGKKETEVALARRYIPDEDKENALSLLSQMAPPQLKAPFHTRFSWQTQVVPETTKYKIWKDEILFEEGLLSGNSILQPKINGHYRYELFLSFPQENWTEEIHLAFENDVNFKPQLLLSKSETVPGGFLKVSVENIVANAIYKVESPFTRNNLPWFNDGQNLAMYVPIELITNPDTYYFELYEDKVLIDKKTFQVKEKTFDIQNLTIDPTVSKNTRNAEGYAQLSREFARARKEKLPSPLWENPFEMPVQGRLTTNFGVIRYVNQEKTNSRHQGIDLANLKGTPILATNRGKVVLSKDLIVTGNTIIVDHGAGLYSHYYHLDRLSVAEGEMVSQKQELGTLGSTGFSTGPHLHFGFYLNGFYIDPFLLLGEMKK